MNPVKIESEDQPDYGIPKLGKGYSGTLPTDHPYASPCDQDDTDFDETIISGAMDILLGRMTEKGDVMSKPEDAQRYLCLRFAELNHEVFSCMFLDTRHRLIELEEMFRGTVDGCSVHPREVVKAALKHNASAAIFAHNHPSTDPEPSRADISLTRRLVEACALVDVRVLDHMVIGGTKTVSFAERGLI
jgi:DNA repair protein RadC